LETAKPPLQPPAEFLTSAGILVDGLQYDIPMPWGQPLFESYRKQYMTDGGKKWLESVMARALPYMAYIQKKVEEYKVPRELMYLPVIESEFSPHAVSPSGAAGIWQFMRNSIAGYDIVINEWVDERRDFMKSTDAAMQKLIENHDALGDWLLAIAAYNAGLGTVWRAVKNSGNGKVDFWHLYDNHEIPTEALNYVPQFLAIASILRYPELHGFPSNWGEQSTWESIQTSRQVDISVLASKAQIPLDILKQGNAELRYDITPPVKSYSVKVPSDKVNSVKAILDDTNTPLIHYQIYKVKSGDTLSGIAKRYGTPMSMIIQTNPRLNPDRIGIGQTIMIPMLGSSGSKTSSARPGFETRPFTGKYIVKKGDTLWSISLDYNTQPEVIARENGLTMDSIINIGQSLKVPSSN
jgi:membrane-bound lytic murein transglycosylase D